MDSKTTKKKILYSFFQIFYVVSMVVGNPPRKNESETLISKREPGDSPSI